MTVVSNYKFREMLYITSCLHHIPCGVVGSIKVHDGGSVGCRQRDRDVVLIMVYPQCGWKWDPEITTSWYYLQLRSAVEEYSMLGGCDVALSVWPTPAAYPLFKPWRVSVSLCEGVYNHIYNPFGSHINRRLLVVAVFMCLFKRVTLIWSKKYTHIWC